MEPFDRKEQSSSEPPLASDNKVIFVQGFGIGLGVLAVIVGLAFGSSQPASDPSGGSGIAAEAEPPSAGAVPAIRAGLSVLGLLTVGAGVSMRPKWF